MSRGYRRIYRMAWSFMSEEEAKKMAGRAESDIIDVYDVEVREY